MYGSHTAYTAHTREWFVLITWPRKRHCIYLTSALKRHQTFSICTELVSLWPIKNYFIMSFEKKTTKTYHCRMVFIRPVNQMFRKLSCIINTRLKYPISILYFCKTIDYSRINMLITVKFWILQYILKIFKTI